MAKIEVGDLVEVHGLNQAKNLRFNGVIGRVSIIELDRLTAVTIYCLDCEKDVNYFGDRMGYRKRNLRKINPDSEPCEEWFTEELKRMLNKVTS